MKRVAALLIALSSSTVAAQNRIFVAQTSPQSGSLPPSCRTLALGKRPAAQPLGQIFQSIPKSAPKDEFETTLAYAEREKRRAQEFLKTNPDFVRQETVPLSGIRYDADRKTMTVTFDSLYEPRKYVFAPSADRARSIKDPSRILSLLTALTPVFRYERANEVPANADNYTLKEVCSALVDDKSGEVLLYAEIKERDYIREASDCVDKFWKDNPRVRRTYGGEMDKLLIASCVRTAHFE